MNTPASSSPVSVPAPMKPRRRWLRRVALSACVGLTLLLALHLTWYAMAAADLRVAREEAEGAGLTLSIDKVVPPPCADADNAALLYQRAFGLLTLGASPYVPGRDHGRLDTRLSALLDQHGKTIATPSRESVWQNVPPDERAAALVLLNGEEFGRVWHLVAEGARLPRCRFAHAYEMGPTMSLPEVTLVLSLGRLGIVRALLLADAGRTQDAVDQLADLLWLRRQLLEEVIIISSLAGDRLEAQVLATLRELLRDGCVKATDLQRCRQALSGSDRLTAAARCIDGDAVLMGNWAFNHLETTEGHDQLQAVLQQHASLGESMIMTFYASWLGRPMRMGDEAAYLRRVREGYRSLVHDHPLSEQRGSFLYPIASMMTPAYASVGRLIRRQERLITTARVALAIAAGEALEPVPGIEVRTDSEGVTLVIPEVLDASDNEREVLVPWRVPH